MKKILFVLCSAVCIVLLSACNSEEMLEKNAVSAVNQIIQENPGEISGTCTKVDLTNKISDDKWEGKAYLDNGTVLNCYVTESGAFGDILVEVQYVKMVPAWTR